MVVKRGMFSRNRYSPNSIHNGTCNSFFSKKGQITVFIIIGIVILFAFAGILYFTKTVSKQQITTEGEIIPSTVPQNFRPIQTYTENCIENIAKEGLLILGQQGGYIYPELVGEYSPENPTDSDGLDLGSAKIPYWHYNPQPNTANQVTFSSLRPPLHSSVDEMSVESQLARYIEERLDSCLQEYHPFVAQEFTVSKTGDKEVSVRIGEENIRVDLMMPISASKRDAQESFDRFIVRIPLRLKHYYEVAQEIADAEREMGFMEHQMLGLIGTFSAPDMEKLPPTEGSTFDYVNTKIWPTAEVKRRLVSLLTSYVPMTQMYGSRNLQHHEFPVTELSSLHQQQYDNMIIPLTGAEDLAVRFDYFGWEPYFDVNDQDDLIKPQHIFRGAQFGGLIPPFAMQRYYTVYDLSYPVLVTVDDPLAFNGEGYQLMIAVEPNIRNNKRASSDQSIIPPPNLQENSLACSDEHRSTDLIKSLVVDSFTKEPLDLVKVGFTVPDQDECEIGVTNDFGEVEGTYPAVYGGISNYIKEGYLNSFYPVDTALVGGETFIGNSIAGFGEKVIEMHKFVDVPIRVEKVKVGKCLRPLKCQYTTGPAYLGALPLPYEEIECKTGSRQCFFDAGLFNAEPLLTFNATGSLSLFNDYYFLGNSREPLLGNEKVQLTLTKVADYREGAFSDTHTETISIEGSSKNDEQIRARLVPGKYKVDAMVLLKEKVVIPADQRSINYDILTWTEEENFAIDEIELDSYVEGLLAWNTESSYLTITPEQLSTADEIVFYVPTQDILSVPLRTKTTQEKCGSLVCVGTCIWETCDEEAVEINARVAEDMQIVGALGNISRDMRSQLEPLFVKKEVG